MKTGPKSKKPCVETTQGFSGLRGDERIRTAVAAFAELSLATRPRHRDLVLQTYAYFALFQTFKS
jgi:hypothetical protein